MQTRVFFSSFLSYPKSCFFALPTASWYYLQLFPLHSCTILAKMLTYFCCVKSCIIVHICQDFNVLDIVVALAIVLNYYNQNSNSNSQTCVTIKMLY